VFAGFGIYFYKYYKNNNTIPKNPVVYILLVVALAFSFLNPVKVDLKYQNSRVIKSFDSELSGDVSNIRRIDKEVYSPKIH
jgi:hypothetical protein